MSDNQHQKQETSTIRSHPCPSFSDKEPHDQVRESPSFDCTYVWRTAVTQLFVSSHRFALANSSSCRRIFSQKEGPSSRERDRRDAPTVGDPPRPTRVSDATTRGDVPGPAMRRHAATYHGQHGSTVLDTGQRCGVPQSNTSVYLNTEAMRLAYAMRSRTQMYCATGHVQPQNICHREADHRRVDREAQPVILRLEPLQPPLTPCEVGVVHCGRRGCELIADSSSELRVLNHHRPLTCWPPFATLTDFLDRFFKGGLGE